MQIRTSLPVAALLLLFAPAAFAQDVRFWPDGFTGRLEAFALIEQLNGALLASRSATATLESWCADHHMARPARLTAIRDSNAGKPATPADRNALAVEPNESIRYRRVELACGAHVLSQAENWYVPSRLTANMNRLLDTTQMPFGRVIRDLHPTRQTLRVERLWSPLPPDWDRTRHPATEKTAEAGTLAIPRFLFRHRAVVFDGRHRPIALVVETYTSEILNYPR